MLHFLKNMLKKREKEDGSAHSLLFAIVGIFGSVLMMIIFIPAMNNLYTKSEIDHIKRQYILKMEVDGYLTQANEQDMITKIMQKESVSKVIINPRTTKSRVAYGDPIYLDFDIEFNSFSYVFRSFMNIGSKTNNFTINFFAESTSTY